MSSIRCLLISLLLSTASTFAGPRVSADGEKFPDAVPVAFKGNLPLVRDKLGGLPEDMGTRVFNSKKSEKLFTKNSKQPMECEWFVLGFSSSDITGFDLTDGRVSRIVWRKNAAAPLAVKEVREKVARPDKQDSSKTIFANQIGHELPGTVWAYEDDRQHTETITFAADPLEWFILHHPPATAEISDAMRKRSPAKGMTADQASATFGKSASSITDGDSTVIAWEERKSIRRAGFVGSADDVYRAMQDAISNPAPTRIVRRVTITFVAGVAVRVTDERAE